MANIANAPFYKFPPPANKNLPKYIMLFIFFANILHLAHLFGLIIL
jgi:hypothetical protein